MFFPQMECIRKALGNSALKLQSHLDRAYALEIQDLPFAGFWHAPLASTVDTTNSNKWIGGGRYITQAMKAPSLS
jgi:hypothetical protein